MKLLKVSILLSTLLISISAHAGTNEAQKKLIKQWEESNDTCQQEIKLSPEKNPDCIKARKLMHELNAQDIKLHANGVWVSRQNYMDFSAVTEFYGLQAQSNPDMLDAIMPAMMQELQRKMSLEQMFAIWNKADIRYLVRQNFPLGWLMLTQGFSLLEKYYWLQNNPRLRLNTKYGS